MSWNPGADEAVDVKSAVTVLCGFLGAGKTTVLNHILRGAAAEKVAVVVNDLGEVNIDAALIRNEFKDGSGAIAGLFELQGGCICCSIQADLLDALLELWQKHRPSHIVIEATGVAEPESVLRTLYSGNPFGRSGTDFLEVANMVTVVDGGNMETYFESPENTGRERRTHLMPNDQRRPLQELLMEQIECADILLINKCDLLSDDARQRFSAYLRGLNENAVVWQAANGAIDAAQLLAERRFSEERTLTGASWRQTILGNDTGRASEWQFVPMKKSVAAPAKGVGTGLLTGGGRHHKDYGLETWVFNARRPFAEDQFLKVLRNRLPGVLRAKGFFWSDRVPDRVGLLSIAGKMLRTDYLAEWWHVMIERGESDLDSLPEIVRQAWLPEFGDRRQELVFIGINLDGETLQQTLAECLCDTEADSDSDAKAGLG